MSRKKAKAHETAEITPVLLKPGIETKDVVAAGRDIEGWLRRQPGFLA